MARETVVLIIGLAGQAPCRRLRLSSNVRAQSVCPRTVPRFAESGSIPCARVRAWLPLHQSGSRWRFAPTRCAVQSVCTLFSVRTLQSAVRLRVKPSLASRHAQSLLERYHEQDSRGLLIVAALARTRSIAVRLSCVAESSRCSPRAVRHAGACALPRRGAFRAPAYAHVAE